MEDIVYKNTFPNYYTTDDVVNFAVVGKTVKLVGVKVSNFDEAVTILKNKGFKVWTFYDFGSAWLRVD